MLHPIEIEVHRLVGLGPGVGLITRLGPSMGLGFLGSWALEACWYVICYFSSSSISLVD